jgi:nucleoside-diphosphate-sugar epimerase
MKIFITGSSGFVGGELAKQLSDYELVKYDLVNGHDILNYEQLKAAMKGCDVVVHLAAIPAPREGKTFQDYFKTNCIGTFNVAQAALENNVKRVIFSSSTTYYGVERGIPFPKPIKEKNPIVTQFATTASLKCRDCDISYSTSKVIAEQVLANYGLNKKIDVIILRLGPVRKRGVDDPFLGTQVSIDNAVHAIKQAIKLKEKLWYEAFTIMNAVRGVDISKAKKLLGYRPT